MSPGQITHGDVLEIIETLREQGKRLKCLAASRSYIGPQNAACRQGLRKRARRAEELALIVMRNGPQILGARRPRRQVRVLACPVCDHVLEPTLRAAGMYCPTCKRVITPRSWSADRVSRLAEGLMDTIDRAVTDSYLPG
jgi:hypothetical protein